MNASVQQTYFTASVHLLESISCYPTLALELKPLQTADFFFFSFFFSKAGKSFTSEDRVKEGNKSLSVLG